MSFVAIDRLNVSEINWHHAQNRSFCAFSAPVIEIHDYKMCRRAGSISDVIVVIGMVVVARMMSLCQKSYRRGIFPEFFGERIK